MKMMHYHDFKYKETIVPKLPHIFELSWDNLPYNWVTFSFDAYSYDRWDSPLFTTITIAKLKIFSHSCCAYFFIFKLIYR